MKYLTIFCLLLSGSLLANNAMAIDDYDEQTGFYFRLIESKQDAGPLTISQSTGSYYKNLYIYNPSTKSGRNLFQHNTNSITGVLIPSAFNLLKKQQDFLSYGVDIKNNRNFMATLVPEKILVETYDSKIKTFSVWSSPKNESKPKRLFSYQKPAAWHYDVKANVIRLVTPDEYSFKIENYDF
jgi:hypothetical protein